MEERIIKDINNLLAQLFQKMKESGYEWDAEKKELKKIEQKPDWSEEDKKMSRLIGNAITDDGASEYLESKGIQVIDAHVWLYELKDRVQPQPKQEWSEEDKQLYNDLSDTYFYNDEDYPEETYKLMLKRVLDWMTKRAKSLRPQSTWKPSDEQMEALEHFVRSIGESGYASPYDNDTKLLYSLLFDLGGLGEE